MTDVLLNDGLYERYVKQCEGKIKLFGQCIKALKDCGKTGLAKRLSKVKSDYELGLGLANDTAKRMHDRSHDKVLFNFDDDSDLNFDLDDGFELDEVFEYA